MKKYPEIDSPKKTSQRRCHRLWQVVGFSLLPIGLVTLAVTESVIKPLASYGRDFWESAKLKIVRKYENLNYELDTDSFPPLPRRKI